MSITPGYTNEQIREFVYAYERQPWGTKQQWIDGQPISHSTLRRWKRTVFHGDLDTGLVPRKDGTMTPSVLPRRVQSEWDALKSKRIDELEKRVADLEHSNSTFEATNDALGKAIGLLHELNVPEPGDDPEQKKPFGS